MVYRLLMIFSLVFCVSCGHKKAVIQDEVESLSASLSGAAPEVTGSALEEKVLSGKLALTPFRAGPKAFANEETDQISMMALRGIKESLDEQSTSITVVDTEGTKPDIALQGYIEEYSKSGRMSRMMLKANKNSMIIEGEVWLISTGQRLLVFTAKKKFNPKKEKPLNVAYQLGRGIGEFIGKHAK
jgi:hypothetical protein